MAKGKQPAMVSYSIVQETRGSRCKFEIHMIKRPPDSEKSLVEQYISEQSQQDQKRIVSRIMVMARRGPHKNREKYGQLGDGIYTVKPDDQHRIPFFYGKRHVIVLTHGFFKVQNEAPPKEVARAKQLRDLYNALTQGRE